MQKKIFLLMASLVTLLLVAACGAAPTPETITVVETVIVKEEVEVIKEVEGETVTVVETVEVVKEVEKEVVVTATPGPRSVDADWPDMTWEEVLAEADGQTINWYHWGGSANINNHVTGYMGDRLKNEFNITLNTVHINDTVEAVNLVLGEVEAGRTEDGSVDMIWINGENFKTLRQADLLFGPYAGELPNNQAYVDTEGPYFEFDFGYPIQGYESLWESAQMVIEYDSAVVSDPPQSIPDWVEWVCENPGSATYSAPPDFTGTAFLTSFFYYYTGGHEQWQGRWTDEKQALFDEKAPAVWDVLNEIEPCLWRGGETYATDPRQLDQLMGNGEILFNMNYESTHAAQQVRDGLYPESIRNFVWDEGTVANASYVAIPVNSPNKAAALVVANMLLDPEAQLEKADPEIWGAQAAIDMSKVPDDIRAAFDAIDRGEQTLPLSELSPSVPPLSAEMLPIFEAAWRENVLEQ